MDKCYDQRIDEHYTSQDSMNKSENHENPYRLLFIKSPDKGLERKFLITDEICDDENFDDDRDETNASRLLH